MSQLTVIIPAYNEQESLPSLLDRLDQSLRSAKISYSAIVVDDHSSDSTVRIVNRLANKYPVQVVSKKGIRGKAQSILEGAALAKSAYIVMLDADLQYPPEAIPEMLSYAIEGNHGVVVARRKVYDESVVRKLGSRGLAFLCGRMLHGFSVDIQSGLKLFKKDILSYIDSRDVTPWSLDLPLLHTAKELGFTIGEIEIDFVKRPYGESKLSLLVPTVQIIHTAIKLKFRRIAAEQTEPTRRGNMAGAGVKYRGKTFITHSTLHHSKSALTVITPAQRSFLFVLAGVCLIGLGLNALFTVQVFVAILSFIYFIDVIFNFFLILKSLHSPPEIAPTKAEILHLQDKDLPIYTILCPLYKEAHVIPQFVEAISAIDWPKDKLEVMLLLEEDDVESVQAVKLMNLPKYIRAVVVPDSQPKTKPKACNYGLNLAKGEYVVIYDAEDKPDINQLKIAYLAFQTVGPEVKCLQAKLNYYNPTQNWLTRLFTAEYSLWFDVILTGLQSIGTTIPLGGTSNHFRTTDLLDFEGWDPFNVTEDCDLGVRLFKKGAKTAIIDSTTLEEANSNFRNWIRQRSRWIKGYMQTYLLHMRDPKGFADGQGIHAVLFQLTVGGKIAFILINPILWVLTIAYFVLYQYVGLTIESLYPSTVFYMAVTSLIFGNFMFIYYYMIGAAKRGHWGLMKWIYLVPLYWLMVSIAGAMALYQLIVKPHYWEKTIHGLHLKKVVEEVVATVDTQAVNVQENSRRFPRLSAFRTKIGKNVIGKVLAKLQGSSYRGAFFLVIANIGANLLNMIVNLYTGHVLQFADFGIVNTFTSILYLVTIPTVAIASTINYKTAYLTGKFERKTVYQFWKTLSTRIFFVALVATGIWLVFSPFLADFFGMPNITPILVFAPLLFITILTAVDRGYLKGRMLFTAVALITLIEPIARFILTVIIAQLNLGHLLYIAIPFGTIVSSLLAYWYASREKDDFVARKDFRLPADYFWLCILAGMSSIAFFSLDNILTAHYLGAVEAGKYALLGLVGKMIYFAGNLILTFITPLISNREGKGEETGSTLTKILIATSVLCVGSYIALGLVLPQFTPYLGEKFAAIAVYFPIYCLGIMLFTISQVFVNYYLTKRDYLFPFVAFVLAIIQIFGFTIHHANLNEIVQIMFLTGLFNFMVLGILHIFYKRLRGPLANVVDLFDLFAKLPFLHKKKFSEQSYRVLILNWRDTKHIWAGGAEYYIQEVAEYLVSHGHPVTIFSGNDGKSNREDTINDVHIVRRGGFYTVYFWAFVYYVFKFRRHFDIVIDCENGIPFLTPLYVRKPIFLLIHHIHQEVFREHLAFPLSLVANFIESQLMPGLYQYKGIITVSESSKKEIIRIGLGDEDSIHIVNPGINARSFAKKKKTKVPSIVYVGRLKPYKNVDILIRAFHLVLEKYPLATLTIAGYGESLKSLVALSESLHISKRVSFVNSISDDEKRDLFARSWISVQPSMIEGWGITVIEANAAGTPVIASNVKGLRDSIQDGKTGVLVEPKNIKAFKDAMVDLIRDTRRRERLSDAAREWATDFVWEKESAKFVNVLDEAIQEHAEARVDVQVAKAYGNK